MLEVETGRLGVFQCDLAMFTENAKTSKKPDDYYAALISLCEARIEKLSHNVKALQAALELA